MKKNNDTRKLLKILAGIIFGMSVYRLLLLLVKESFMFIAVQTKIASFANPLFTWGTMILISGLLVGVGGKKGLLKDWIDNLK